ncbi:MAG TPA: NAD(P)H-hydrate dehydratase [Desulfuromonadales bacterium]|nr:NAD(P)H-hydrate dehydratase [Desulfuromonadales bacterium]
MKLLTAAQMQEMDRRTIEEIGIPGAVLMENAGRGMADRITEKFAELAPGPVLILAGKGNNGGDGYVIARHLNEKGWQVQTLVLAERSDIGGDAKLNLDILEACGGGIAFATEDDALTRALSECPVPRLVIDALLGTGLTKPVKGKYATAIDWINRAPAAVAAVDIPSGLHASTGQVLGCCVSADLTATFGFAKIGQASYPGAGKVGELAVIDIGIPQVVAAAADDGCLLVTAEVARQLLPLRPADGHKGTFGHLLAVAGSVGKTGAAIMTCEAALRAGCGLVTLACPAAVQPVVASQLTEVMSALLADTDGEVSRPALSQLKELAGDKQALAVGPGLGLGEEAAEVARRLIMESPLPLVVDADGLTALVGHLDILQERAQLPTVLTPHPGEMARLVGTSVQEIQKDRVSAARDFAGRHKVVVVLKGARTVTALPDGRIRINGSGHAGMASGGMGDVLTGLVGSLLAQGLDAGAAAVLAVYLHGNAGDRLAGTCGDAGLLASDLIAELPGTRKALADN